MPERGFSPGAIMVSMQGMLRLVAAGALVLPVWTQNAPPRGIVRGTNLAFEGSDSSGTFQLQSETRGTVHCRYDSRTYMERAQHRISISGVEANEIVEVLLDSGPDTLCHALILRVIPSHNNRPSYPMNSVSRTIRATEWFAPRGNLTFAGVILEVNKDAMVLRTRRDGNQAFLLRKDTRYTADGTPAEVGALEVNTKVFIRAGRNLDNQLEVYSVSWGDILKP